MGNGIETAEKKLKDLEEHEKHHQLCQSLNLLHPWSIDVKDKKIRITRNLIRPSGVRIRHGCRSVARGVWSLGSLTDKGKSLQRLDKLSKMFKILEHRHVIRGGQKRHDVIDPNLWPIITGVTGTVFGGTVKNKNKQDTEKHHHWLPTPITIKLGPEQTRTVSIDSYLCDLPTKTHNYLLLQELLADTVVPLFNRILEDLLFIQLTQNTLETTEYNGWLHVPMDCHKEARVCRAFTQHCIGTLKMDLPKEGFEDFHTLFSCLGLENLIEVFQVWCQENRSMISYGEEMALFCCETHAPYTNDFGSLASEYAHIVDTYYKSKPHWYYVPPPPATQPDQEYRELNMFQTCRIVMRMANNRAFDTLVVGSEYEQIVAIVETFLDDGSLELKIPVQDSITDPQARRYLYGEKAETPFEHVSLNVVAGESIAYANLFQKTSHLESDHQKNTSNRRLCFYLVNPSNRIRTTLSIPNQSKLYTYKQALGLLTDSRVSLEK
jgi:hypothetical protein